MRKFVSVSALLIAIIMPWFAMAQITYQYPPPAPGLIDAVARGFFAADNNGYPLWSLQARVAMFGNEEDASAAITPWFEQIRADGGASEKYDSSSLYPIGIETVADETRAMVGTAVHLEDDSFTVELGVMVIRDGNTLYAYVGWSTSDAPIAELIDIGKRVLGIEPLEFAPVPDIPYNSGGLFDLLPRIEHLPRGMTWGYDLAPCVGVFGASPCVDNATPGVATPESTPLPRGSG